MEIHFTQKLPGFLLPQEGVEPLRLPAHAAGELLSPLALREVDAFFRTGSALAYGSQAECQRIHICSLSVHSAQIFSSCFRQSAGLKYDGFFAGTSFSSNSIAHRPEPQATWRILGTGMSWDAAANLQVCCTSAPHAAHRDMRQTATHTETRTTTLDPDRTGFSPGISFVRTNHP